MNNIENGNTTVLQIMEHLSYGELEQYSVAGFQGGGVTEDNYPKLMSAINRGVNEIQKDLGVFENTVAVELKEHIGTYALHSKYSLLTGTASERYIDDSAYFPFEDDVLQIRQILTKEMVELPINNRNHLDTVYVPQHNVIQHPYPKEGDIIGVVYSRYTKPTIVETEEEAAITFLPIPDPTLDALYAYVASLMTSGITTEQEISESQMWRGEYERRISKLKESPMIQPSEVINTKLTDRGFV